MKRFQNKCFVDTTLQVVNSRIVSNINMITHNYSKNHLILTPSTYEKSRLENKFLIGFRLFIISLLNFRR